MDRTASKTTLRMLHVIADRFPPYRPDIKVLLGQQLASRGHEIDVICQSEEPCDSPYETTWNGLDILVGPTDAGGGFRHRLLKHLRGIRHDFRMIGRLRKKRYDCIQVKDKFIAALVGIIASRLFRIPFIYWLSFSIPEASFQRVREKTARYPLAYLIRGCFTHVVLYWIVPRFARHIFVQSDRMKEDFVSRGVPSDRLTPVPMGVSVPGETPPDGGSAPLPGEPRALYLGAMDRPRHLEVIIEAFAMVRKDYPEAKLYMVGGAENPDDVAALQRCAEESGAGEGVVFTGFLAREDAWDHVRQVDVCLSPMYPSPMFITTTPTKCMEYLGLGKPVVGNDIPDMHKVLTESGGGVCVPWGAEHFARGLRGLFADPERAAQMGLAGREWIAKNREYGVIADALERKYFDVLKGRTDASGEVEGR